MADSYICKLRNKFCEHALPTNNREIGYEMCSGEYCDESNIKNID